MTLPNIKRILKSDYLMLLPILVLAFYIALIPRLNYPYPVHIDEWATLAQSEAILKAGNITFIDPFLGTSTVKSDYYMEAGHNLFWATFHQISGLSWLTIFRYFPGVVFIITVLSAFVLGRRQGFGWEAAFFTSLIPTSVGILGPAFLVPVASAILFIPLSLYVAFNFRHGGAYVVLFIFTSALFTIHAATAVGLVIILAPYILLNLKSDFKHSLGIALALGVPSLVPFLLIPEAVLPIVQQLFSPQSPYSYVDYPRLIQAYGYLPIAFCLLGTLLLAIRGKKGNYDLILGLLALLLTLATFFTFHIGIPIVYDRGLLWAMLMMSIVAGAGLMEIKNLTLPSRLGVYLKVPLMTQNVGKFLCLVLVGLTLFTVIPNRLATPYYHMIDTRDYEAFAWIRDNVNDNYERAILDPWKATAFTAITGKKVYSRIHAYPKDTDKRAYGFLEGGAIDTAFLREKGISIIYTLSGSKNPDLVEVRKNVYLLKEVQRSE